MTFQSSNYKTGPMPVSISGADTCPETCGVRDECYAKFGPLAMHWSKVTDGNRGTDWETFCHDVSRLRPRTIWRHNQAGDLPGKDTVIDRSMLEQLVEANRNKRGFTFTHKPVGFQDTLSVSNSLAVSYANENGFTINLSADTLEEADELYDLGIGPVVVALPSTAPRKFKTPKGRTVVVCPFEVQKKDEKDFPIQCVECKLCTLKDRKAIIGFWAHGVKKRQLDGKLHLNVLAA